MPSIRVINDQGDLQVREVVSRNATVSPQQGDNFSPAVVQRVEYDHKGGSASVTTVCGETENRRSSDKKPDITIEGIITEPQLDTAKQLREGDEITLVSDVHQGRVFVKRLTIEQNSDIVEYIENGESELAFAFQLQLKQPE